jgi:diguanylate cyclase (GGDEF)-like protein
MRSALSATSPRRLRGRTSTAAVSRWTSVGLGLLLMAVSVAAIVASQQVSARIDQAASVATAGDMYQDARFYATREDGELETYRVEHSLIALDQISRASASLEATLARLQAHEGPASAGGDGATVADLTALHLRYVALVKQVIDLVDTGQVGSAASLEMGQVQPLQTQMAVTLTALEEKHHTQTAAALRAAHQEGALLLWGTPIALALALLFIVGLSRITRRHRRTVEHQALHDALTGLPNRSLLVDRAAQLMSAARRSGARPVVMMLDLDRFKDVNDTLGYHRGDELLVQVAGRLSSRLRPADTVARLGGDEFAILVSDGGSEVGTEIAERILRSFESPFNLGGVAVGVEASIGIAVAPDTRADSPNHTAAEAVSELLRHADVALYQAKADRCGFRHFVTGEDDGSTNRLALLGELRQALERDELVLHYQPKVAADTAELIGVEALVRWQHPIRGLLAPGEFIGLAEGTTLIHRLTIAVLDKALDFSRSWLDRGVRLPVAVNVSARSLLDKGFATSVAAQLAAHGLPADLLWIELTEGTIMSDPDRAIVILHDLRAIGVRLSVDDFGTGYSSMSYLKILPVDELKIDRSFVKGMATDESDAVLVQSAIDLGHNLGLSVVAEGVEDEATLVALKDLGVDIVQGYYLGRPMPQELLREWVERRGTPVATHVLH